MLGYGGRGDIAMGDAVTCISPSTDPGTVLLAEMHRKIFLMSFHDGSIPFPPVCCSTASLTLGWCCHRARSTVTRKERKPNKLQVSGDRAHFLRHKSIFLLVLLFLSYIWSGKNVYEMRGDIFPPALTVVKSAAKNLSGVYCLKTPY